MSFPERLTLSHLIDSENDKDAVTTKEHQADYGCCRSVLGAGAAAVVDGCTGEPTLLLAINGHYKPQPQCSTTVCDVMLVSLCINDCCQLRRFVCKVLKLKVTCLLHIECQVRFSFGCMSVLDVVAVSILPLNTPQLIWS